MDPITVTSSCVGLIAAVARLSLQVNSFVGTVQAARNDMRDVLQELDSLTMNLRAFHEGDIGSRFPPLMLETLLTVLKCCDKVVEDMRTLLERLCSSRLARLKWTMGAQDQMNKLRTSLESYKSTIMISLQIGSIATRGPDVTRVLEEVSDLRRRLYDRDHVGYSLPLQRFLDESVTYAETVIDTEVSALAVGVTAVANTVAEEDDNHQTPQLMENTVNAHRALFTLRGHSGMIRKLNFSPDGALLASQSGSSGDGVQLWRMRTGVLEATVTEGWTTAFSFSRNGRILAGGVDKGGDEAYYCLSMWNVRPNISIKLSGPRLRQAATTTVFAPDDKSLAYGCEEGNVGLLDVETGACQRLFTSKNSDTVQADVRVVQFSSSGRFLASASLMKIVKLWDLKRGNKYSTLTGCHHSAVNDVAFSPNEQYLASAGREDEKVALWNVAQGTLHAKLRGHTSYVDSVEFLDDGMTLISACQDYTVKLWDVRTGQQKISITGRDLHKATICTSRHLLASAFQVERADYAMYLRRLPTGSLLAAFRGFDSCVMIRRFDPSGLRLVSGHLDGSIRIWDAECKPDTVEGNISTDRLVLSSKRT